jgi:glycosyltransferase involved in cell wall biosynthesis
VPSPYQVEFLSAVAAAGQIELEVRFMRATFDCPALSTVPHRILSGLGPGSWRDEIRLHPRAILEVAFGKYDCYILSGLYTSVTFLTCAVLLWVRRKPWAMWLERPRPAHALWSRKFIRLKPVRWIREVVTRILLRAARRVVCIGTAAVEEYAAQGVPHSKLGLLPYCCDVSRFDSPQMEKVHRIREQLAIVGKTVFLFSGQLIERKGVDVLIRAFVRVGNTNTQTALLILGDGPLRDALKASVPLAMTNRVHFIGPVAQVDLPSYFAAADVFVFPSRHDGWGVVINEACAAGLPVIATRQTGAARDLVVDGVSGFIVEREDTEGLAGKMQFLAEHPAERKKMGLEGRRIVESFSVEKASLVFSQEVQKTIQHASVRLRHSVREETHSNVVD